MFIFDGKNEPKTAEEDKRFFVADFYCSEKKFIVGIDGDIHKKQKKEIL